MSTTPRSLWNGTIAFGEVAIPDVEPEPEPVPDLLAALEASLARVT